MEWKNGTISTLVDGSFGPLMVDQNNIIDGTRLIAYIRYLGMLKRSAGLSVIAWVQICPLRSLNALKYSTEWIDDFRVVLKQSLNLLLAPKPKSDGGMLSFVVGLFIFYQAMSLFLYSASAAGGDIKTNRCVGWQLTKALCLELLILVLLSWICGNVFGLMLAEPTVASGVFSLVIYKYDANVGLTIDWNWR
ncbi:hypothetical protein OK016_16440 [Vibrio chagasii]|nr:hypothetical protein [Vibrio chagasii]